MYSHIYSIAGKFRASKLESTRANKGDFRGFCSDFWFRKKGKKSPLFTHSTEELDSKYKATQSKMIIITTIIKTKVSRKNKLKTQNSEQKSNTKKHRSLKKKFTKNKG